MPDNKKIIRPHDAKRISLKEPYELERWTQKFGVSAVQLQAIIDIVGDSADAVQAYIDKSKAKR